METSRIHAIDQPSARGDSSQNHEGDMNLEIGDIMEQLSLMALCLILSLGDEKSGGDEGTSYDEERQIGFFTKEEDRGKSG